MAKALTWKTSIKKDGPIFDHDPIDTFQGNVHRMVTAMADEGARDVRGQLRVGDSGRAPIKLLRNHVSDHVAGELRKKPSGPNYSFRIFVRNRGYDRRQATSMMAAAGYLERTIHPFRKTRGRLMRSREINAEELAKGLD